MHSVTLDGSGSPRKRTLSRGMSEDESLRSIIKETETSSRRLTRSDSRAGTLKRRTDSQQSEQDFIMGLPEMLELQASYDEVVQELRGLEVEREALLFQVDVLQDTLEGVEELLAEAQREAGQATLELEREREAKGKLESMVCSLMQEVERLKEERNNKPPAPVNTEKSVDGATRQGHREEPGRSACDGRASDGSGRGDGPEEEGNAAPKLRWMAGKPLSHVPSLALDLPLSEDGVLQRPYENGVEDDGGSSPDRNDSDSTSAYEDASAETPEHEGAAAGVGEPPELPRDSQDQEANHGHNQDPKNPDACVVS